MLSICMCTTLLNTSMSLHGLINNTHTSPTAYFVPRLYEHIYFYLATCVGIDVRFVCQRTVLVFWDYSRDWPNSSVNVEF